MRSVAMAIFLVASLASPVGAQTSKGLWSYQFQNGIGQYSTGQWDSPTGGALALACKANGNVDIMPQIKGQGPAGGSRFTLTTSSKAGSRAHSFTTGQGGALTLRANAPALTRLWADLRARDIVTVRYADGTQQVLSLSGAKSLLPARPCG